MGDKKGVSSSTKTRGNTTKQKQSARSPNTTAETTKNIKNTKSPVAHQDAQGLSPSPTTSSRDLDRKQQQRVLDVFRHAFSETFESPSFSASLQSVKQALYDRDFARAFGDPEHLAVYAARWSPTRALCYASVLCQIEAHLESLSPIHSPDNSNVNAQTNHEGDGPPAPASVPQPAQQLRVLSIGGGAAELVAFAAYLHTHPSLSGAITLLDSGPWSGVISHLTTALTSPPPLSPYASAAAKLSNTAFISPSHFIPTILQRDALTLGPSELTSIVSDRPLLITLLFTLNELFTAGGLGKTTTFLLALTAAAPSGSLLLVVDSPGSYSETSVGKDAKRYPMQWLLDRILLQAGAEGEGGRRWAKVDSRDSVWFRLDEGGQGRVGLEYPIALEDMRFQMHLYRLQDGGEEGEE